MHLTALLDVAIGLTVVYLGASLFVTIINEYIGQILNLRGKKLYDSLQTLIDDETVENELKELPALRAFFDGEKGKAPSYVDTRLLAKLLLGTLARRSAGHTALEGASEAIDTLKDSTLKTQLQAIVSSTSDDVDEVVDAVSEWADRSLTTLGEGYKRNLQWISLAIGLAVAGACNLDTIALTSHLYRDKAARDAVVGVAVQVAETNREAFNECMVLSREQRKAEAKCEHLSGLVDAVQLRSESLVELPIGWFGLLPSGAGAWVLKLAGWILTALALSLGAPFWFDLLNRFVSIRHGMRKPDSGAKRGTSAS